MKTTKILIIVAALSSLVASVQPSVAQGTAFTYQGRLQNSGIPANGLYDFRFNIIDAPNGGTAVAATVITNAIAVSNGLFTVSIDFGQGVFTGPARWLEITVSSNNANNFFTLSPRHQSTPVPYAIMANSASNLLGTVAAGQLSGTVSSGNLAGTYGNAVAFNNPGNSYTGNGANLSGVNAATLGGLGTGKFWQTGGNAGTTAGVNYVGTTDNQALELHVNGSRVLRLEPNASGANVISGDASSSVATYGATIGGGGNNQIQTNAYDSTIGGGNNNQIQTNAYGSTIGGGVGNIASSPNAFVGGGASNVASGTNSIVAGGKNNTASAAGAFVGGGGYDGVHVQNLGNLASGLASVVSGGTENTASGVYSVVGGGDYNRSQNLYSAIGGGEANLADNVSATVSGGANNTASGLGAVVGGGGSFPYQGDPDGNTASGDFSTVGGGNLNVASGQNSTVAGGYSVGAYGINAAICGGYNNSAGAGASVLGGVNNFATGNYSAVAGGLGNDAYGNVSFAAGYHAEANYDGDFVWSDDSSGSSFSSTGPNQFCIRAAGGVVMATASLRFPGAGADTSTPVFTHKATSANVSGNKTYIDNPGCNGQPNAILIITENWSAGDNVGNSKVVGVYYDAGMGQWTIFVDDGTAMPIGVAYNVMVTSP
jgi:hypothetical protein